MSRYRHWMMKVCGIPENDDTNASSDERDTDTSLPDREAFQSNSSEHYCRDLYCCHSISLWILSLEH